MVKLLVDPAPGVAKESAHWNARLIHAEALRAPG
jgi:hypothetical protein